MGLPPNGKSLILRSTANPVLARFRGLKPAGMGRPAKPADSTSRFNLVVYQLDNETLRESHRMGRGLGQRDRGGWPFRIASFRQRPDGPPVLRLDDPEPQAGLPEGPECLVEVIPGMSRDLATHLRGPWGTTG